MRIYSKYLGKVVTRKVTYLSPWQKEEERPLSDPDTYKKWMGKKIRVMHYHKPYEWNFYIQLIDEKRGNTPKNRRIWYGYNFMKMEKIEWPKHLSKEEIMDVYKKKTPAKKVKILEKAMEITGSKTHRIAVAMGYYYTDDYNEPTWVKSKSK